MSLPTAAHRFPFRCHAPAREVMSWLGSATFLPRTDSLEGGTPLVDNWSVHRRPRQPAFCLATSRAASLRPLRVLCAMRGEQVHLIVAGAGGLPQPRGVHHAPPPRRRQGHIRLIQIDSAVVCSDRRLLSPLPAQPMRPAPFDSFAASRRTSPYPEQPRFAALLLVRPPWPRLAGRALALRHRLDP